MIHITRDIAINENEIHEEFIRSSGPGGQNVNKVATAVQLRYNIFSSPSLPEDVRDRLVNLAGKRITGDGTLIIKSGRFRTQNRNRRDALDRLVDLIRKAVKKPKARLKTRPTLVSRRRRLTAKIRNGEIKRLRKPVAPGDY